MACALVRVRSSNTSAFERTFHQREGRLKISTPATLLCANVPAIPLLPDSVLLVRPHAFNEDYPLHEMVAVLNEVGQTTPSVV